jgi:hypothetical protein
MPCRGHQLAWSRSWATLRLRLFALGEHFALSKLNSILEATQRRKAEILDGHGVCVQCLRTMEAERECEALPNLRYRLQIADILPGIQPPTFRLARLFFCQQVSLVPSYSDMTRERSQTLCFFVQYPSQMLLS